MTTKIMFAGLCIAAGLASCIGTSKTKGIVTKVAQEDHILTATITSDTGDTLSFSIPSTSLIQSQKVRSGDTLEVMYSGQYHPYMVAESAKLHPQQLFGGDSDSHGCIGSAGYKWSEVQKDCIRLWEEGIRLESTDGSNRAAFIVFAPDSMQVELFFSDGSDNEILQRRTLPSGTHVWNVEDDDTKNVRREADGQWTISQRTSIIFRSSNVETAPELGKMQVHSYEGLLPAASCPGIEYKLTIRNREHSGDGTFQLILTYKEAENGEDRTFTYNGKRLTMRGIPGDGNATVWQCISDGNNQVFNFLREDENTLTLLNDKCEKAQTDLNYSLKLVE